MDQSIFGRLPVEMRLEIYHNVFRNTRIIVKFFVEYSETSARASRVMNQMPEDTNLTMVCRAIRDEALPALWSEAVVTFMASRPFWWLHMVSISRLRQAINDYPSVAANWRHITQVNGIKFPCKHDDLEIDWKSLLDYLPNLKSCNHLPIRQRIGSDPVTCAPTKNAAGV